MAFSLRAVEIPERDFVHFTHPRDAGVLSNWQPIECDSQFSKQA